MPTRRESWEAALTGLAAFAASLVVLRFGIAMTPDSWAYWQGSVSLLDGSGYSYFFGLPILRWPPGYPFYLAAWQALFGVEGSTLVLATAATTGLAAALWALWLSALIGHGDETRSRVPALAWIAAVLAASASTLASETLFLVLLPLALWLGHIVWSGGRHTLVAATGLGVALGAAALVRNATLALLPGVLWLTLRHTPLPPARRLGLAGLVTALAILPWWAVRTSLGQGGSHAFGLGRGRFGLLETAGQLLEGLGAHVAPGPFGILLVLGLLVVLAVKGPAHWHVRPETRSAIARQAVFAAVGCVVLLGLFVLTPIHGLPAGRFTRFAALAVVPPMLWLTQGTGDRRLRAAIAVALLLTPLAGLAQRGVRGAAPARSDPSSPAIEHFVGLSTRISPEHVGVPARRAGRFLYVSPPLYPWLEARLARERSDGQHTVSRR